MPSISVFFGIIIRMFYNDHEPPHFHAEHQGLQGKFDFDGDMLVGAIESRTACASSGSGRYFTEASLS